VLQSEHCGYFLLLAHCVPIPNVVKRTDTSVRSMYIDHRRPTSDFGKFQMAITLQCVIRSTSGLVLGFGFRV